MRLPGLVVSVRGWICGGAWRVRFGICWGAEVWLGMVFFWLWRRVSEEGRVLVGVFGERGGWEGGGGRWVFCLIEIADMADHVWKAEDVDTGCWWCWKQSVG